ncbi:MAG: aminotransferase class III-fold pyridoxal phosphate-dependent enzyme [Fuerstiella sp.]|nr:aminotransferase class III-fold pyridoxal phosphate-dependent enzyme [Fuerstiella sp.]
MESSNKIFDTYRQKTQRSVDLFKAAGNVLPGGIAHDSRYIQPHPVYIDHAAGSRKWDVDGNEYIDYFGGHGALLLGHNHADVTAAVTEQLQKGTHFGTCHEPEVLWARQVQKMLPSAELVRFTSSGTEATMLAFRLARAFTDRPKILRFKGHFHGWQDHAAFGVSSHFDGTPTPGILPELSRGIVLGSTESIQEVRKRLQDRDIAAVILEPTGGGWGRFPLSDQFVRDLRIATSETDTLLIMDEVICGFRCSPGGAQADLGITPDITTLAKVLAGGFPGGAVTGRRDVLGLLDMDYGKDDGREKVPHQGTYNANPVSAAAGLRTLQIIEKSDACEQASAGAARLRASLNEIFREENIPWVAYGTYSGFHICTNPEGIDIPLSEFNARMSPEQIRNQDSVLIGLLRVALLIHGIDIAKWPGGIVSAVHSSQDTDETANAFRQSVKMLRDNGIV